MSAESRRSTDQSSEAMNRPLMVIHPFICERPFLDRKADISHEAIVVRRNGRLVGRLLQAHVGRDTLAGRHLDPV